jgi:ABC-type Zn2+ transport system substrate-binding protein/surface adhesin
LRPETIRKIAELLDERVGEQQQHGDTDADHWHGVEQTGNDEHLHLELWAQFWLTSNAIQELAAKQSKANGGAESAQTDQQGNLPAGSYR